ncbi:MAG: hypothetical protein QOJ80_3375 [Mycobacterium sp.]|nr:hypothetical protein [Mycobacterium sp.]
MSGPEARVLRRRLVELHAPGAADGRDQERAIRQDEAVQREQSEATLSRRRDWSNPTPLGESSPPSGGRESRCSRGSLGVQVYRRPGLSMPTSYTLVEWPRPRPWSLPFGCPDRFRFGLASSVWR